MIQTVDITLDGVTYPATLNAVTGLWEVAIAAPAATSYHRPGGYYPITITAANDTGRTRTVTPSDPTHGAGLRLYVTETTIPVVGIISPTSGSFLPSATPTIAFSLLDDELGSGINLASVAIDLNGTVYGSSYVTATPTTHGYDCQFITPPIADGAHTISITISDNDGNVSEPATVDFSTDTVPPSVTINAPSDGAETRRTTTVLSGVVTDANAPLLAVLRHNGAEVGALTLTPAGTFSRTMELPPGVNTLTVWARDVAGNTTEATVTITRIFDFAVITDRTQADVDAALTAPPSVTHHKGMYNISDLNRVEGDVYFLAELLREMGQVIDITTQRWDYETLRSPADLDDRYLGNVRTLRDRFALYIHTPPLPLTVSRDFDHIGANNIETVLLHVYERILNPGTFDFYAGELYSGEI